MQLFRYFTLGKDLFASISDLGIEAEKDLTGYRELLPRNYDHRYICRRIDTERTLYEQFRKKGGKPQKAHPYYLTVENCDQWFFGKRHCFGSLVFDLDEFDPDTISFTYGDSIPTFMDEFDDGREYRKQVYTLSEIKLLIQTYGYPQDWNPSGAKGPENYIEAQVWSDHPIMAYRPNKCVEPDSCVELIAAKMMQARGMTANPQKSYEECLSDARKSPWWSWFCRILIQTNADLFQQNPVHGIAHGQKCACMALVLASLENLDEQDTKTLILAGLYHDIGRKHYQCGRSHGQIGADLVVNHVPPDEAIIMEALQDSIRYHDAPDGNLLCRNQTLRRLKDLDTLDYLRLGFGEYDPDILRGSEAKKMVQFALELNIRCFLEPNTILNLIKEQ
jgi:hypothetical protein